MTTTNPVHQGQNIKRFRELLQLKQEALASELGEDWNQRKISLLEQKEVIDEEILQKVAGVMNLPVDIFKRFTTEDMMVNVQNNFEGSQTSGANVIKDCLINPEYQKVIEENKSLYERLLASEKEKNELLKKMLDK